MFLILPVMGKLVEIRKTSGISIVFREQLVYNLIFISVLLDMAFEAKYKQHPKKSSSNGDEDMAYHNEAALEAQFDEQLNSQDYFSVSIHDYDTLLANFKITFEVCEQESGIWFAAY